MKKKLTANQLRIAKMAPPFNKITGADFAKLKKKKKKQLCLVKKHPQRKVKRLLHKG